MTPYAAYRLGWNDAHTAVSACMTEVRFAQYCKDQEEHDRRQKLVDAVATIPSNHFIVVHEGEYFAVNLYAPHNWKSMIRLRRDSDQSPITDVEIPADLPVLWWDGETWSD